MKELYFLLLFFVGAVAVHEYHGDRRFWTDVDSNGRTKVAQHVLNESVNLIFPKDKTTAQLLPDIKLLSPGGNVKCQDTLLFDDQNHIRGEIKAIMVNGAYKVTMYLYQKCGVTELPDDYATGIIEGNELPIETIGMVCFKDDDPFHHYGTDTSNNAMELQVSPGAFGCPAVLILPDYMLVEDAPSPKAEVNPLNSTFAKKGDYWWKKEAHEWLPFAVSFVGKDVLYLIVDVVVVVDMELLVDIMVQMIQLLHLFLKLSLNSIQLLLVAILVMVFLLKIVVHLIVDVEEEEMVVEEEVVEEDVVVVMEEEVVDVVDMELLVDILVIQENGLLLVAKCTYLKVQIIKKCIHMVFASLMASKRMLDFFKNMMLLVVIIEIKELLNIFVPFTKMFEFVFPFQSQESLLFVVLAEKSLKIFCKMVESKKGKKFDMNKQTKDDIKLQLKQNALLSIFYKIFLPQYKDFFRITEAAEQYIYDSGSMSLNVL